jgi:hypothetical protein
MAIAAFSPALAEHTVQVRPYGLMALLVLASCFSMINALHHRRLSDWAMYIVSTLLLLYTHHWAWLITAAQQLAAFWVIVTLNRGDYKSVAASWVKAWVVIAVAYLPWLSALLYQAQHAGHGAFPVDGPTAVAELVTFSLFISIATFLFGGFSSLNMPALAASIAAGLCGYFIAAVIARRSIGARPANVAAIAPESDIENSATRALIAVVVGSIAFATIMSPVSNQLLARCIATLVPLFILLLASFVDSLWRGPVASRHAAGFALLAFIAAASVLGLSNVAGRQRSNAKEVALQIDKRRIASDLLVIAPEWFAASFNNYFPPSIEQVDFPYESRSGLIDFSNVWQRATDSLPLLRLSDRLSAAAAGGRRVWLVSDVRYLRGINGDELRRAAELRDPAPYSILRVSQIRAKLEELYGPPDSAAVTGARPLYDDLRAYLYSPSATKAERR